MAGSSTKSTTTPAGGRKTAAAARAGAGSADAPGYARVFHGNRHVYTVISPRSGGLMVGVNLNSDRACNFDCVYCDVERPPQRPAADAAVDMAQLAGELEAVLGMVQSGALRTHPNYRTVPAALLELKQVAISGDGEPTLCPQFAEAVEVIVHLRAVGRFPFFKLVLITNGTGLNEPFVQQGLKLFTAHDEVWVKLDAGTQDYMDRINQPGGIVLDKVLANIRELGRKRPVIIQSLFAEIDGAPPPQAEIVEYAQRLKELLAAGARIAGVQIYSASRTPANPHCRHLPLKTLSLIAQTVKEITGLKARVF